MTDGPFERVVLVCDAACDITVAVTEAAALAARWGVALHGVYVDDENLHRYAALPFGQHVSLSANAVAETVTPGAMARLSSALGAQMRRAIAEVAKARGLDWTYGAIRDLPSAISISSRQRDLLVIETARAFSGAWRPRAAWEKTPAAFTGTVLFRGQRNARHSILVLLPERQAAREKVLAATAALALAGEAVLIAGTAASLADSSASIRHHFSRIEQEQIKTLPLEHRHPSFERLLARHKPALVVVDADDAAEALDHAGTDVLLVR